MVYMLIIGAIFAAANIYASHIMFWTKIEKIKKSTTKATRQITIGMIWFTLQRDLGFLLHVGVVSA